MRRVIMGFTVAIDGPAAAGKGTIAKAIAAKFNFSHLDTGTLYRAVGLGVLNGADPIEASENLNMDVIDPSTLRTAEVAQAASKVASLPKVRAALVDFQQKFASRPNGAVLDGRDIGTVICPTAQVKLYVTASAEVRAQRRFQELMEKGDVTTFDTVLKDVVERDKRDTERSSAPLVAAPDACVIDTSELTIEQAVAKAIAHIDACKSE
eukprot:m.264860 g.264860  ORF g.264860 m.264860 type:complete len:209 (+) comp58585_c0_seq1:142-768(+)